MCVHVCTHTYTEWWIYSGESTCIFSLEFLMLHSCTHLSWLVMRKKLWGGIWDSVSHTTVPPKSPMLSLIVWLSYVSGMFYNTYACVWVCSLRLDMVQWHIHQVLQTHYGWKTRQVDLSVVPDRIGLEMVSGLSPKLPFMDTVTSEPVGVIQNKCFVGRWNDHVDRDAGSVMDCFDWTHPITKSA